MPELPEVETLRLELQKVLAGKKVKQAKVLWAKAVRPLSAHKFEQEISGKKIKEVRRQAKILIIDFSDTTSLAIHLKMTGQLIYEPKNGRKITGGHPDKTLTETQPNKFTRVIIDFTDKSHLYFNDIRKFGWAKLIDDNQTKDLTKNIGVEPLSKNFTDKALLGIFKRFPNRTIKKILMDQTLIAGIGNIYTDEACFKAKLLPTRQAKTLKPADITKLRLAIISILKLAIKKKGTSADTYRRSTGQPGGFVPYLNVYGRANESCKLCKKPIQKIRHAGRGTHFCQHCQK